ncbi:MAG: ABC transporter permease [Puniceicoccales bacterium]|jgi:NitT/TauT family transport system permease protein|nr:ABC transporter permease [Puniceicoccales bacterium]
MPNEKQTPAKLPSIGAILAPFIAVALAFANHSLDWPEWLGTPSNTPVSDSPAYPQVLGALAAYWAVRSAAAFFSERQRVHVRHNGPLIAAGIALLAIWQTITAKLGILPMPFFPGPDRVFEIMLEDVTLLRQSAFASLRLLSLGFLSGSTVGFAVGVWFGWNRKAAYWGMPVLKFFGPVPSTAWIPFALMLFPTTMGASVFILALASLFPMVVLTASGIANTRHSHLEVARTLGATPRQLILHVAIPSALPSIFTGLFMALSASFITLVVAEAIGVKAGLGFYINWAQNFAEYHKIFASLLLMAVFFSSLMSALFFVRDRVLRWQQGLIKW